MNTPVREATEK